MTVKNIIAAAGDARKSYSIRKAGGKSAVSLTVPVYSVGLSFLDTLEGGALFEIDQKTAGKISGAFKALPEETRKRYTAPPAPGGYLERLQECSELIRPVLTETEYHEARRVLLLAYRRSLRFQINRLQVEAFRDTLQNELETWYAEAQCDIQKRRLRLLALELGKEG